MTVIEKIREKVQKLSASFQSEVLECVVYLLHKIEHEVGHRYEEKVWAEFSLNNAMRGIREDDAPTYSISDVKVSFS